MLLAIGRLSERLLHPACTLLVVFVFSTMQVNKFFALGYRNDPAFKEAQSKPCPKDGKQSDLPQAKRKPKAAKPAESEQTDPSARRLRKRTKSAQ